MSTTTLERLPNTVTACHAMIRELLLAAGENNSVAELSTERDELKEELRTTRREFAELEARVEEIEEEEHPDIEQAIHALLDECERTGPLRYDVPQSDRTYRAIVALHGCVGRNP